MFDCRMVSVVLGLVVSLAGCGLGDAMKCWKKKMGERINEAGSSQCDNKSHDACVLSWAGRNWQSSYATCTQHAKCAKSMFVMPYCNTVKWTFIDQNWVAECCCTTDDCNNPYNPFAGNAIRLKQCWKKEDKTDVPKLRDCGPSEHVCEVQKINGEFWPRCQQRRVCRSRGTPVTSNCTEYYKNSTKHKYCCCMEDNCNEIVDLAITPQQGNSTSQKEESTNTTPQQKTTNLETGKPTSQQQGTDTTTTSEAIKSHVHQPKNPPPSKEGQHFYLEFGDALFDHWSFSILTLVVLVAAFVTAVKWICDLRKFK